MKKTLLSLIIISITAIATAQVAFNVTQPSSLQSYYDITFASGTSWGVADMEDPANFVIDTLVVVDDGSAADSLGCLSLINRSTLEGNIAVVFRGDCEFGLKALNAQDSGATAVIIINNIPGAPIGMNGGAVGLGVTIPVIMVSDVDGAAIVNAIRTTGPVVAFIGNKLGYYQNDLTLVEEDVVLPKRYATLDALSKDASELEVKLEALIRNNGADTQYNIITSISVVLNGTSLYQKDSLLTSLVSGDSALISFPTFSQATYANGLYKITYSITSDSLDNYSYDNTVETEMVLNSTYISKGKVDSATSLPLRGDGYYPLQRSCMAFKDANASRINVTGMVFSAVGTEANDLTNKQIIIAAYEWDGASITSASKTEEAYYVYNSNLEYQNVSVDFDFPFTLNDNQDYLFCAENDNPDTLYFGASEIDHFKSRGAYGQFYSFFEQNAGDPLTAFVDITPNIAIKTVSSKSVNDFNTKNSKPIKLYPNPTEGSIRLETEFKGFEVTVFNVLGKVIKTQEVLGSSFTTLDLSNHPAGVYFVTVQSNEGNVTERIILK